MSELLAYPRIAWWAGRPGFEGFYCEPTPPRRLLAVYDGRKEVHILGYLDSCPDDFPRWRP